MVDDDSGTVVRDVEVVVGGGTAVLEGAETQSESDPDRQPSASARQDASHHFDRVPRSRRTSSIMART